MSTTRVLTCVHNPCTPHLSHATLSMPTQAWHPKGGAQVSCTRGRAHTQCGRGLRFPSVPPRSHALGFCVITLHVHQLGERGEGRTPWHAPHANGRRGACHAGCMPAPTLAAPPSAPWSLLKWQRAGDCAMRPRFWALLGRERGPRLFTNRGATRERAATGPAFVVLFDLSGGKGERVGAYLSAPLCTPRLRTRLSSANPARKGEKTARPPPCPRRAQEGALRGVAQVGAKRQEGRGNANTVCIPPCSVHTKGEGAETGRTRKEETRRGVLFCLLGHVT